VVLYITGGLATLQTATSFEKITDGPRNSNTGMKETQDDELNVLRRRGHVRVQEKISTEAWPTGVKY